MRVPQPTAVYDTYWRFAAERQRIWWARMSGQPAPWTDDSILREHKFTNAYRVADRVSQFLIQNVILAGDQDPAQVFFRTIVFKIFNKIETWEGLTKPLGAVEWKDESSVPPIAWRLSEMAENGSRIYSAAYMMPPMGASSGFESKVKHVGHLQLVSRMMQDRVPDQLVKVRTMGEAVAVLQRYPLLGGNFLPYQYATDLAYSDAFPWSEMDFVVPGPGALDGISKCFSDLGDYTPAQLIRAVTEAQRYELSSRGLEFVTLWGRPLQLIDCQNLFCEISKYARKAHPEVVGSAGRTQIKQRFKENGPLPVPVFPARWHLDTFSEPEIWK